MSQLQLFLTDWLNGLPILHELIAGLRNHYSIARFSLLYLRLLLPVPQQMHELDQQALCEVKGQPPVRIRAEYLPGDWPGQAGLQMCRVPHTHLPA